MEFSVLGPIEVRHEGRPLPLGGQRKRALLATLLLNANQPVAVDKLIDVMWGEQPPPTAATTVYVYVSQLRKELGRDRLVTNAAGYVLEVHAEEFDRSRFERLVVAARLAADPAERAAVLREALALWRGPALADLRYEPVAELEAERLEEERLIALEERLDAELELGLHERLIGELEELSAAHPLRERLRAQLMLALYRSGRQAAALATYRDTRHVLRDELGIEPGPALRRLEQSILNQDPALGADVDLTPPRAVERERPELREERKVVTVLFADIAGFTRHAEELDPENVRILLRRFHEPVRAELERFGGTVEKFVGDAVMAVFGAPVSHEDDAERAVRAAFAVRDAARRLQAEQDGLALDLRIGVNTGEVLAVVDADARSGEGIVAGDVVNTAARLQTAAPINGILVGEATHRATCEAIEYREVERMRMKGKARPVVAAEAVRVLAPLGAQPRRAGRRAFVGRSRERELLDSALGRVGAEDRVELVTLVGEPGIGKSRLVSELAAAAPDRTIWLTGRCLSYGGAPYVALSDIVKAYAGVGAGESAAEAAAKVDGAVTDDLPEADWVRSHLRLLVGLESRARGERREMFAAWRRFFESLATSAAVVLVFEDIHWADEDQLDFLESFAAWGRGAVLVLCTARTELRERRPAWRGVMTLPPLSDDETSRLLNTLIGDRALPPELLERIGGNPLFAEEFARSVAESAEPVVPESVQATIAARIDLLPPREKAAFHAAAVLGKTFDADAVAALRRTDLLQLLPALESLRQRELIRSEGGLQFAFGHVLIRDVAYGQIPRRTRAEHHRLAAEWVEKAPASGDERIEAVAYHYITALDLAEATGLDAGDLPERARDSLARAGERSLGMHAYQSACEYFDRARALGGDWRVHEGLGRALQIVGRRVEARASLEQALAETSGRLVSARLSRLIAVSLTSEYQFAAAHAAFDAAEGALDALDLPEAAREWIDIQLARLTLLYWEQDPVRMDMLMERARPVIEQRGEPRQQAEFLGSEYLARLVRERYRASEKTVAVTRRFLAARIALGDPADIARARFNLGFVHVTRSDLDDAQRELEQALATADWIGDAILRARSLTYLALLHRRRRDVENARSLAEQALDAATELHMPEYVGSARATLAWVAWTEDDAPRAEAEAAAALDSYAASAFAFFPWEWTARLPLLAIAVSNSRIADAQEHARRMLDVRQQPLPERLEALLQEAIAAEGSVAAGGLRAAVDLAVDAGLL